MDAIDGRGGVNLCGPYEPVIGWPLRRSPGRVAHRLGRGLYVESPDRVVAVYGGEVPAHEHKAVWGVNTFRDLRFTEINGRLNPGHRHCHEIVVYDRAGEIVDIVGPLARRLPGERSAARAQDEVRPRQPHPRQPLRPGPPRVARRPRQQRGVQVQQRRLGTGDEGRRLQRARAVPPVRLRPGHRVPAQRRLLRRPSPPPDAVLRRRHVPRRHRGAGRRPVAVRRDPRRPGPSRTASACT